MWETRRMRNYKWVRGPIFRRAESTSWGGLGPLKILGMRTFDFAFTQQKSGVPCPKKWVCVPKFKRAVPKMTVV
jgi:hypothetical protein